MIDVKATEIGDTQRAMFALIEEVKMLRGLLRDCRCLTYGGYSEAHLLDVRGRIDAALGTDIQITTVRESA